MPPARPHPSAPDAPTTLGGFNMVARDELMVVRFAHGVAGDFLASQRALASRFDMDPTTLLVFLTVAVGCTQRFIHSGRPPRAFPLGDDEVTPMSRRSVALATNLPRETVRRRLADLVANGRLEERPEGVRSPAGLTATAPVRSAVTAQLESLRRVYAQLGEPERAAPPPAPRAKDPAERAFRYNVASLQASYAIANHFLIAHRALARVYDLEPTSLILQLTVATENIAGLVRQDASSLRLPLPDYVVIPVARQEIARLTGIPRETVRRRVAAMVASGALVSVEDGVRMPYDFFRRYPITQPMQEMLVSLRRLSETLAAATSEMDANLS